MTSIELFEPIGHESVADSVIGQIERMIAAGILKEGRRLPAERNLAEALGVSRPKLREALQSLEGRGLVQTRHGEGTFIAPLTGRAMLPALQALYGRHEPAFFDYLEYRRAQEEFAARLAAERATRADKARLREILRDLEIASKENDMEKSSEADFQLHSAIVDASQNATLIHMMASIYDVARQRLFHNRDFLRTIDGTGAQLLTQHKDIGEAILEADPARASSAAVKHIDFVLKSFRNWIEQNQREVLSEKRRILS